MARMMRRNSVLNIVLGQCQDTQDSNNRGINLVISDQRACGKNVAIT
jgi:hypothetical protein